MNVRDEYSAIFKLPVDQRLQLVEDLWDSIEADAPMGLSSELKDELARREAHYRAHPETALSWEDVRKRLKNDQCDD